MQSSFYACHNAAGVSNKLRFLCPPSFRQYDSVWIVLIYAICHFPMLLLWEAKYWDDWLIFGMSDENLNKTFIEAGFSWFGNIHSLIREGGAPLYKITTFLVMLVPPLATLKILKALNYPRKSAVWVAILVGVLPFFFSRVVAINTPSALHNALFFIAWVCFLSDSKGFRKVIALSVSLVLFSISVYYQSLASLYLVALLTYGYKRRSEYSGLSICNKVYYIGLLLIPVFTFLLGRLFFSPSGNYESYNSFNLGIFSVILTTVNAIVELLNPASSAGAFILFFLIPVFLGAAYLSMPRRSALIGRLRFQMLACVSVVCAIAPYVVAGKYPSFIDWGNRLQLLFPFGFALLIVECNLRVRAFLRLRAGLRVNVFLPACLISSIFLWWSNYINYEVDWIKQVSIVESIKVNPSAKNFNSFIISDEAENLNVHARRYRFYEVAGMLRDSGLMSTEMVATNFEVQSAARVGVSWAKFREGMGPFINEQYLLVKPSLRERVALLTVSSVPVSGVNKVRIAINGWRLRMFNREKYKKLSSELAIVTLYEIAK